MMTMLMDVVDEWLLMIYDNKSMDVNSINVSHFVFLQTTMVAQVTGQISACCYSNHDHLFLRHTMEAI